MDSLVLAEGRALAETATTVSAAVGFLASVNPEVGGEVTALGEGPSTVRAVVGPLPKVERSVLAKRGGLAEALAAVRATERLLPCVSVQVSRQGGLPGKASPTQVAAMTLVGPGDGETGTEWGSDLARRLGWLLQATGEPIGEPVGRNFDSF